MTQIPLPMPGSAPTPNHQHAPSPAQQSPSPGQSQSAFSMPPTKRPRLSPGPGSQPQSPYGALSPGAPGTPTSAAPSPQFTGMPLPTSTAGNHGSVNAYTNGNTIGITLPDSRPLVPLPSPSPAMPTVTTTPAPYTMASMAPIAAATGSITMPSPSPVTPGVMGPPSRPPDRPAKEIEYEPDDMLAGTGIDLREEEQLQARLLYGEDASQGFGQYQNGDKGSFYGAGPMNRPPQAIQGQSQNEALARTAEAVWGEASFRLAQSRSNEIKDPFIQVSRLHARAEKIAKEYGLSLNKETRKDSTAPLGRMRMPEDQQQPSVRIGTKTLPDSTVIHTYGSIIPPDAYLADQLALISIACKQRLGNLIEDASRYAHIRQTTSHGEIPDEWQDVAAPVKGMAQVVAEELAAEQQLDGEGRDGSGDGSGAVAGSAATGNTNPRKRSLDQANGPRQKIQKIEHNTMVSSIRDLAKAERDWEEARLRRRQAKKDGTTDQATGTSRAGSVAPGTPGSVAPEPGAKKEMTKKEQRKSAAAKAMDAGSSQASSNKTSNMFMGRLGGVFGKKKAYGWMTAGSRSGSNTPARPGTPGPSQPSGAVGAAPEPVALTSEGRNRLGLWREDGEKGKKIQLRDWIAALEADKLDLVALQVAYNKLDSSGPSK